ncbi:MAG TPA: hypothetical protein PKL70_15775 [Saprospiraceae bacterium]|nr:hypothetical protein [Saprospiraceae bacterium]
MKIKLLASILLSVFAFNMQGQVMPPSNLRTKILKRPSDLDAFTEIKTIKSTKYKLFPFRGGESKSTELSLAEAFNTESVINGFGLGSHSIFFDLDSTSAGSIFTEALSIFPQNNLFKFSIGTNISISESSDTTKTKNEIAYQKLLNGGGNFIFSVSRPIFYLQGKPNRQGNFIALLVQSNINLAFDVKELNQIIYEPGFGFQWGLNADFNLLQNPAIGNGDDGNLYRFGLRSSLLYNFFNEKFSSARESNRIFNNLFMYSGGIYFGIAMFDISVSFNNFGRNDPFFDDKSWALKVGIVPVKF